MRTLYHIIVAGLLGIATPFVLLRMVFDSGFRAEMRARHRGGRQIAARPGAVWVHASSAGEVRAARILIDALKAAGEPRDIALSTFTRTGFELAGRQRDAAVFRLPFDFPFWTHPLLNRLQPSILVLIEAEFWPSLLSSCNKRNIPVLLVNGRLSETSRCRYARVRWFFRWATGAVSHFSMRSQTDADRLLSLGIDPARVSVTGNIKFDARPAFAQKEANDDGSAVPWLIFGSTRPGDEGPILEAVCALREPFPELNAVIAPRHPERSQEVEELIREYGVPFEVFSRTGGAVNGKRGAILLLDTLGELNRFYAIGTVAFVGGGFNPRFGGHNILEPAAFGLPVLFGRHMNNFEEEARRLKESGGGIQIERPDELRPALLRLLTDTEERARRGRLAAETIAANRGAVEKNIALIEKFKSGLSL